MNTKFAIPSAILYIVAWILCSVILIAAVLVFRQAVLDTMTAVQAQAIENAPEGEATTVRINAGFVKETVDRVVIIVGALAAVGFSVYFEYYFRKGREKGVLAKRIGKVMIGLLSVLLVSVIVQTLV